MSKKMEFIPKISSYDWIAKEMNKDLEYRLLSRSVLTSLGRPLYKNINVQVLVTRECPYNCDFCIEKKNPIGSQKDDFKAQVESLKKVLIEHRNARLTITGGEPSLFLGHVQKLLDVYFSEGIGVFANINTTGYIEDVVDLKNIKINLSCNKNVNPRLNVFKNCVYQTVFSDDEMNIENISNVMNNVDMNEFSFRFLTQIDKKEYDISIWNELQSNPNFKVKSFRVGDFFVYATFEYNEKRGRITLGDMRQQRLNNYKNGYSNIIIHSDGVIGVNWN